jgi:ferritin-like metal-binding protein YciE
MPTTVSNPRDLLVIFLGEILHVERRLVGGVLQSLIESAEDEHLRSAIREHLDETRAHVDRVETIFRRIEVAPTALLSRPFEAAVAEHDDLAAVIPETGLADVFHAHAARQTEHWELATYRSALTLGEAMGLEDHLSELRVTIREEEKARDRLLRFTGRLADRACGD